MLEKYVLQDISFPFINVKYVSFKLHCQEIVCWALNIWPWFKPFSAPSPIHPLQKIFACQNVCLSKYLCFLLSIWYQMHNLPFVTLDLEKFKHIACWKVTTEKTQHKINVSTTRLTWRSCRYDSLQDLGQELLPQVWKNSWSQGYTDIYSKEVDSYVKNSCLSDGMP